MAFQISKFEIILIILIIVLSILIISRDINEVDESIAKCIGENSVLYVQLGCSHCEKQKDLFGESAEYLNIIDCYYSPILCENISATPTWIINNSEYKGTYSIEDLQSLTGCL